MTTEAPVDPQATPDTNAPDAPEAAPSTNTADEKLAKNREKYNSLRSELSNLDTALKQMERTDGGSKQLGYKLLSGQRDKIKADFEAVHAQIEHAEKIAALAKYTDPIIAAFGRVTVADAKSLPTNINIDDLGERTKAAQAMIDKGQSLLTVINALEAAVKTAQVPEDATEDLKPFQLIADGEKAVKIAVASRAGGRTGTRTGGGRGKLVRITKADDKHQDLVGKSVGKDGDFDTWRTLVSKTDSTLFDELEKKRAEGSNWSGSLQAQRKFGVEFTEVEAAPAPAA